jgi:hypothetical protein
MVMSVPSLKLNTSAPSGMTVTFSVTAAQRRSSKAAMLSALSSMFLMNPSSRARP